MLVRFTKMNGAGNDFVLIDNRQGKFQLRPEEVVKICHRQRGVGADGLLLLVPSQTGKADWAWDFYNNDGSTAEMCGNGARCFARYIQREAGTNGKTTFETGAGIITASFQGDRVTINLTDPKDLRLNQQVPLKSGPAAIHSLNTGVPHAVMFVADADKAMVQNLGAEIRYHQHFAPRGTNANFVQVLGPNQIRVRTYERGVEGETLACGTGVTASALIAAKLHGFKSPVTVKVQGGDRLEVTFREQNGDFRDVHLTGPADFVFDGQIEI
ncbi:MAG TPA: diaminopimelate epimerase [Verrucomicrobiae bacterium]|nr:diaminopimelate epimerase [Verrucomicrobiae bacterium]